NTSPDTSERRHYTAKHEFDQQPPTQKRAPMTNQKPSPREVLDPLEEESLNMIDDLLNGLTTDSHVTPSYDNTLEDLVEISNEEQDPSIVPSAEPPPTEYHYDRDNYAANTSVPSHH